MQKYLDVFDKFLDDMVESPLTSKEYQTIHDIFAKHLNKKQKGKNVKNKTKPRV